MIQRRSFGIQNVSMVVSEFFLKGKEQETSRKLLRIYLKKMNLIWTLLVGQSERSENKSLLLSNLLTQVLFSTEKVRCVSRCSVVTVDKKELKRLCMMIRWPFFGYGIRIPSMDVWKLEYEKEKECQWDSILGLQVCVCECDGLRTRKFCCSFYLTIAWSISTFKVSIAILSPFPWNHSSHEIFVHRIAGMRISVWVMVHWAWQN